MKGKLFGEKVFRYIFYILPGIVLYYLLPYLKAIEGEMMLTVTTRLCVVYIISCILLAINALLLSFLNIYNTKDKRRSRPMKGLVQVFQVVLFFVGGIIIVSVLITPCIACTLLFSNCMRCSLSCEYIFARIEYGPVV